MNTQKWIGVGIVVVVLVAAAYFIGQSSNHQTQSTSAPAADNTSGQATTTNQVIGQSQQQTLPAPNQNLVTESTNGLNCKTIAYQAASLDQSNNTGQTYTVLRSHYSQSLNQCYYEVSIAKMNTGALETDIRVTPDDTWVAYCNVSPSGESCGQQNVGLITEQQFQQLETYYLTN